MWEPWGATYGNNGVRHMRTIAFETGVKLVCDVCATSERLVRDLCETCLAERELTPLKSELADAARCADDHMGLITLELLHLTTRVRTTRDRRNLETGATEGECRHTIDLEGKNKNNR